jgi:hypothetical protein
MGNQVNSRFTFGFLNNNQDAADLRKPEATLVEGLDADRLALGTLEGSDYYDATDTAKDWSGVSTDVVLNGRKFYLSSGSLYFYETPGGLSNQVNDNFHPPTASTPVLGLAENLSIDQNPALFDSNPSQSVTFALKANESYTGASGVTIEIIITNSSPYQFVWKFSTDVNARVGPLSVPATPGTTVDISYGGLIVAFNTGIPTLNAVASSKMMAPSFADGDYSYLQVNVKKDATVALDPEAEIQGVPSAPSTITVDNFDEVGVRTGSFAPQLTFPTFPLTYTDEVWLFRRGPDDAEYIRVAKYDGVNVTAENGTVTAGAQWSDNVLASAIASVTLLVNKDDETFSVINTAINNTSSDYLKLFEKDNRLWMQPYSRQDLLLYSRAGDWWGWNRSNTFSFEGNITDLITVRDPTTVGGSFTTVVGTTKGLYHINGDGTEANPYVMFKAIPDIYVEANSMVDANGVVMFITRSTDAGYDTGPYGQKVYEYNLQAVKEVSQRVKNSSPITTQGVSYAKLSGSDKYVFKKTNNPTIMVYHRDAKNWVTSTQTLEASGLWKWTSKRFTPQVLQRFKIEYARKFKVSYSGSLRIRFVSQDGNALTANTVDMTLPTAVSQQEFIQRLPSSLGRTWTFEVQALTSGSILYDFYFVR